MKPAMVAKTAPMIMAMARRTPAEGMVSIKLWEAITPAKAPTLIKPAWPRLSSPSTPTVRFSETAMTT